MYLLDLCNLFRDRETTINVWLNLIDKCGNLLHISDSIIWNSNSFIASKLRHEHLRHTGSEVSIKNRMRLQLYIICYEHKYPVHIVWNTISENLIYFFFMYSGLMKIKQIFLACLAKVQVSYHLNLTFYILILSFEFNWKIYTGFIYDLWFLCQYDIQHGCQNQ